MKRLLIMVVLVIIANFLYGQIQEEDLEMQGIQYKIMQKSQGMDSLLLFDVSESVLYRDSMYLNGLAFSGHNVYKISIHFIANTNPINAYDA